LNVNSWWRWYRNLSKNPIYLREKGQWGKPNPFYDNLLRFSPFVVLGGISLGFCTGFGNPAFFGNNDDLFAIWCLLCLPGILLSMLTIFGSLLAPALTAPMISLERDKGTWDILLVTPQPMMSILMAKLFGALSRLRIWPMLFVLSLFQGLILFCSLALVDGELVGWDWLMGLATVIRPWLEILFAAFMGLFLSTVTRSATMAVAGAYALVVIFKLFNSSLVWMGLLNSQVDSEMAVLGMGAVGPTAVYTLAIMGLWIGIFYQARKMIGE
jgi:ABC-type transport system involved in multi-copper enzyme maturation permease subunit